MVYYISNVCKLNGETRVISSEFQNENCVTIYLDKDVEIDELDYVQFIVTPWDEKNIYNIDISIDNFDYCTEIADEFKNFILIKNSTLFSEIDKLMNIFDKKGLKE